MIPDDFSAFKRERARALKAAKAIPFLIVEKDMIWSLSASSSIKESIVVESAPFAVAAMQRKVWPASSTTCRYMVFLSCSRDESVLEVSCLTPGG